MPNKKTKKTNPKVTKARATVQKHDPEVEETKTETQSSSSNFSETVKNNRVFLSALFLVIAIGIAASVLYHHYLVAAYVNGEPISRLEVIHQLEKTGGKAALQQIVTEKLVDQEARKRNINVSQKDIDVEIKTIEDSLASQGMTLDQALQSQGMTRAQLQSQMKTQVELKKLVKTPTVSDKEVEDYITKNESQLPSPEQRQANFNAQIKEQLLNQKQQEAVQKFISDLQSKANIKNNITY